jgi:capsular exopolysaccharide synthesis family protein
MSQIFDALQRAEAERSGADTSSPLRATEILERAEKLASTEWEKEHSAVEMREVPAVLKNVLEREAQTAGAHFAAPAQASQVLEQVEQITLTLPEESRLVCVNQKESPAAEAFRLLGVRIRDLRQERKLQKILVTSTIPQEGKSTVAANLACALAESGKQRVLLLEGDVRKPTQSRLFGLPARPGVSEWLQGTAELAESLCFLPQAGLWVMQAGAGSRNPIELVKQARVAALMEQLEYLFDLIVIDSPPVLPMADTSVWTRLADGILVVAQQGTTEKRQLTRGLEALEKEKLIGALLNCVPESLHPYYYY